MSESVRFLQFGCWNNLNFTKTKQGTTIPVGNSTKVMELVKSKISEDPPKFIIVSGDNYYPDKNKSEADPKVKTKDIFPDKLRQGLMSLPEIIPIYMILGNHDLETNTKKNLFIVEDKAKYKC
jgi:predicted MPP superfamily phosphohydrolase